MYLIQFQDPAQLWKTLWNSVFRNYTVKKHWIIYEHLETYLYFLKNRGHECEIHDGNYQSGRIESLYLVRSNEEL